jgi:tetratricopeptide (TPR) repeat protein
MRRLLHGSFSLLLLVACRPDAPTSTPTTTGSEQVPFFEGMGAYGRTVTTRSKQAQRYFDQGLALLHGFNHDESIRSFEEAAKLDPDCAMAHFGVALANGPHINNPKVPEDREKAAVAALTRAKAASGVSELERELIDALAVRHADPQPADRRPLDEAFADAMRKLWEEHPDDADIGAWFAESMMDLRPWDLWTLDGEPQPGTLEVIATLEAVIKLDPDHPLALHLYIHAVEGSKEPDTATPAAETLQGLVPGHGHLEHMPSHIFVRTGRWVDAVEANASAVEADQKYRALVPEQDFYRLYMAHNRHMLGYAATMVGRSAQAIQTMNDLVDEIPRDWAEKNTDIADGYLVMPMEVLLRFGKWDEILAIEEFPETLPLSRTLRHYGRGVAYAAQKQPVEARAELEALRTESEKVPPEAAFGNNGAHAIIGVAEKLLEGEVLYREAQVEPAIAALQEAVKREDELRYSEPPDWVQPVRHALGALLLEQKRAAEAEAVYREDLKHLPHNGWALWGLARSLRLQKKEKDAAKVDAEFEKVWAGADIQLHSSCMCLPGV